MNSTKLVLLICLCLLVSIVRSRCDKGCDLAYGSYYVEPGNMLSRISSYVNTDIPRILRYNPSIPNQDSITEGTRINLPFSCDCINGEFLGHAFSIGLLDHDTNDVIANRWYANLTTAAWIERSNGFYPNVIRGTLNVIVTCSCGDKDISKEYNLFSTYPLRPGESLSSVSSAANLSSDLIRSYNPNANFSAGSGLVYIPARDENGNYPPIEIESSKGLSGAAIGGIVVGVVALVLLVAGCVYYRFYKKKNAEASASLLKKAQVQLMQAGSDVATTEDELHEAQEREKILAVQDRKVEQLKDQRNTLESFVYDTRSKLSSAYKSFATDIEKEGITKSLQETEDWLYEDSDGESDEQDYNGKLDDLKKLLGPIEKRYKDENAKAKANKALLTFIGEYRSAAELMPAAQKHKVNNQCDKAEKWFNDYVQHGLA